MDRTISVILIISLGLMACNRSGDKSEEDDRTYMTVGYIAGYRDFDFSSVDAAKLSHINFAFANVVDGKVVFDSKPIDGKVLNKNDIEALYKLKVQNRYLKILVSVGGWTWSKNFSDAAMTKESRTIFARSAAEFVLNYKLDGIDIDWEYPNQPGDNNTYREADIENFTLLLKSCREELDKINPAYLLTIASGADKAYIENTRLGEAHKYLDFINIMTYDFHNGLHRETGHHANLQRSSADEIEGSSIIRSVQMHIDAGVPAEKLNLGLPFYGRYWTGVNPEGKGLYQDAESVGIIMSYREIEDNILSDTLYMRYWDTSAGVPWLWNEQERVFISYEDSESIRQKIDYLRRKGLGGLMFWEYSDDSSGELLNTIDKYLNNNVLIY